MRRAGLLVALVELGAISLTTLLSGQEAQSQPETAPSAQIQLPQRVRVSQGVMQGLIVKKVQPKYPKEAKKQHVQGSVILQAIISKTGDIGELRLINGPELPVPSAMDAVKKWKYRPFLLQGQPVEIETQITVNYTLSY